MTDAVGKQLERIRRLLTSREVQAHPPLEETEVARFEERHGIELPEPYRRFLLEVGNGCKAGPPGFGLVGLGTVDGMQPREASYWHELPDVTRPFPFTKPWIWESEPEFDWEDPACVARWKTTHHGSIHVGDDGCGMFWQLVVTGPARGEVWMCCGEGLAPPDSPKFLDWVEGWIASRPPPAPPPPPREPFRLPRVSEGVGRTAHRLPLALRQRLDMLLLSGAGCEEELFALLPDLPWFERLGRPNRCDPFVIRLRNHRELLNVHAVRSPHHDRTTTLFQLTEPFRATLSRRIPEEQRDDDLERVCSALAEPITQLDPGLEQRRVVIELEARRCVLLVLGHLKLGMPVPPLPVWEFGWFAAGHIPIAWRYGHDTDAGRLVVY